MVSETLGGSVMSDVCVDFAQHAWKKDVCCNCQRPWTEHPSLPETTTDSGDTGTDSPKPAKRNSVMTKSWVKGSENEEDQWNSMCLPDPDHPDKPLDDTDQRFVKPVKSKDSQYIPEHCYEDIDGEDMKGGQSSSKTAVTKDKVEGHSYVNTTGNATVTKTGNKTTISINPEERLNTLIKDNPRLPSNQRSRSSSRDKSPVPAPKPKAANKSDESKDSESMQKGDKKTQKGQRTISFVEKDPSVIGDDGGLDNLYSDTEDDPQDGNEPKESIELSETEKDWALQALKNTLWNSEHMGDGDKKVQSKEYEDINKVDKCDNSENDPEALQETQNFGTFPLKKKSEKTVMDNLFSSNRLSTLSESSENVVSDVDEKYESMLKFLGADKFDFHSSPKRKSAIKGDNADFDPGEASYDDPWEDKFAFENQSEMNLLDEIKGEIDLDSSTAGFALVDLLNDVLARYSTGTPSETDSVKNLDMLDDKLDKRDKTETKDGAEKNAEIEAKIVTLAANLRKHRAKGRAPRPPSCPPEPPQEVPMSPSKQAEIRAAQSKEPTFKMVPLGKSIGPNPIQAAQSASLPPGTKPDISSTSSSNSSDNTDNYRNKGDKQAKKSGGIGGFFSRIFGRGKEDGDTMASSETLVSSTWSMSDPYVNSDSENYSDRESNSSKSTLEKGENFKENKRTSKSSPQMKLKVLPTADRPVSPKPVERPTLQPEPKKEIELDETSSQNDSPKPEIRTKTKDNVKTEKSEKNTSQKIASANPAEQPKLQLSPSKDSPKAVSPKTKEAPPLPQNPPREISDTGVAPKPRVRGNSEGGPPRSRPRTRDSFDGKVRATPNVPPPKPPVAVKPKAAVVQTKSLDNGDKTTPPVTKERLPSTSSLEETPKSDNGNKKPETHKTADPRVLRKRAKSPKRFAAPLAPSRASLPNILTDSNASLASTTSEVSVQSLPASQNEHRVEGKSLAFAKELEQKLHKEQTAVATDVRKPSAPPAPPPQPPVKLDTAEKSKSLPVEKIKIAAPEKSKSLPTDVKQIPTKDKDIPIATSTPRELVRKSSGSKDDLKTSPPTAEDKSKTLPLPSTSASETEQQQPQPQNSTPCEVTVQPEKIELPKPAGNSRKSFLGKLNRNKSKPPPPPSVKRTKSVTESTVLGDHHTKKIDLKDISGPVVSDNSFINFFED